MMTVNDFYRMNNFHDLRVIKISIEDSGGVYNPICRTLGAMMGDQFFIPPSLGASANKIIWHPSMICLFVCLKHKNPNTTSEKNVECSGFYVDKVLGPQYNTFIIAFSYNFGNWPESLYEITVNDLATKQGRVLPNGVMFADNLRTDEYSFQL